MALLPLVLMQESYVQVLESYHHELVTLFVNADQTCRDFEARINRMLMGAVQGGGGQSTPSSVRCPAGPGSSIAAAAMGCSSAVGRGGGQQGPSDEGKGELKSILKKR